MNQSTRTAIRCLLTCLIVIGCLFALPGQVEAQWLKQGLKELKRPLVDSDPFDILVLNDNGENAVLKIKPLGKNMPKFPLDTRGMLVFEMFEGFDEKLDVPYGSVESIQSFNELLIEEAEAFIQQKRYANAFRNLLFVYDHGGSSDSKLVSSLRECMFLDATNNFQSKRFELSLSIYEDIYQRDPDFQVVDKPLIEIIMLCYDGIIREKFEAEEYLTVRDNVAAVAKKYPDDAAGLIKRWEKAFVKRSDELLEQSKRYAVEGKGRLAHVAARQADQMVSDRPEVLDHQEKLLQQFPLILVGVSQSAGDADPNRIEHWGARRVGRLTKRRLVEMTGVSDEGGVYSFLNGRLYRVDDAGLKYTFEIQEDVSTFAVPQVNAFDVSMRLLERGRPGTESYSSKWAKVVDRVFIENEDKVSFTLRTPYVRPEALLNMTYDDMKGEQRTQDGPYVLASNIEKVSTFELNPKYDPVAERQHPVIIEQKFNADSTAVEELLKGNIDVVDRVSTADIARLKKNPEIVVRPYVLPTIHMLVPKMRNKELKDDLNFRSGLSHTIDRPKLVRDVICGGLEVSGSEPISGPFPIGSDTNDQIAYGYDLKAKPISFNEKLGMVLLQLSMRANPPKRPEPVPPPQLTIVYPRSSAAANAAQAIARSWAQAGIPTDTRALPDGVSIPEDDDWDFLYMEVSMEEPLADAGRLLGVEGHAKAVSAPIEQTLRMLNYARSWQNACSALRRLHRQVRVDLSVIPLWQVTEHYAYRSTVRNIGRDIIHLYQNVDRWKIDLKAEEEESK